LRGSNACFYASFCFSSSKSRGKASSPLQTLPGDGSALDAELRQEEEAEAKAEKDRPGLATPTDGSRLNSGAAGYSVVWKRGQTWVGIKTHMGYNQEAYDAECAALTRALESAS